MKNIQPPPVELSRWCTCGHNEGRHHAISWSCLVDGCPCDRFTRKEGIDTAADEQDWHNTEIRQLCDQLAAEREKVERHRLYRESAQAERKELEKQLAAERRCTCDHSDNPCPVHLNTEQLAAERETVKNLRVEAQQYKRQLAAERELLGQQIEATTAARLRASEAEKQLAAEREKYAKWDNNLKCPTCGYELVILENDELAKLKEKAAYHSLRREIATLVDALKHIAGRYGRENHRMRDDVKTALAKVKHD